MRLQPSLTCRVKKSMTVLRLHARESGVKGNRLPFGSRLALGEAADFGEGLAEAADAFCEIVDRLHTEA